MSDTTDSRSLGDLFSRLTGDLGTLVRQEMELAKAETKQEIAKAGKAGGQLGAAALTGYLALLFASFALAWLLDDVMPRSLAFFIVAAIYGIAAAVLAQRGRNQMKNVDPLPRQTVETLKEDVQWAKTRNS